MTTVQQIGTQHDTVVAQLLGRAADPDAWERFERQMRATGYCQRPVRLHGQIAAVDVRTGECRTTYSTDAEPDRTLLKCCGNRREAVCPSCAETYRGDAYQLVAAGLRGGKGVPDSVCFHPTVFATLTAPSFGPVHTRRVGRRGEPLRCRPRRQIEVCPHGVRLSCGEIHQDDDPRLGEPLCPECFDYERAVLWNALAPELWRRTAIQIPRELARILGLSHRELRRRVRVSYVKVAEYQRRGSLHFHVVVRLDRAQPRDAAGCIEPPAAEFSCAVLGEAVRAAVGHASVPTPHDERDLVSPSAVRWGMELDVRPVSTESTTLGVARYAAYIAKYATKSTEVVGGLTQRLGTRDLVDLRVRDHARRFIECAWRLGGEPHLRDLRLRRWAHALGFRGHCFTKSRHYSTTFMALRRARHEHVLRRLYPEGRRDPWGRPAKEGASVERGRFRFAGIGYRTPGDAWLAESAAARAREQRRVGREELRTASPGAALEGERSMRSGG